MPPSSLRKRVVELLRPRQPQVEVNEPLDNTNEPEKENDNDNGFGLLAHLYLTGLAGHSVKTPELYFGKTGCDLPLIQVDDLDEEVMSACTGPDGGLTTVESVRESKIAKTVNLDDEMTLSTDGMDSDEEEAHSNAFDSSFSLQQGLANGTTVANKNGCESIDWTVVDEEVAFGSSVSLYERNPLTGVEAGTPIADVFAVCARSNNAILALADGVNWGEGARLAARCAVRGAMDHMNNSILQRQLTNTNEVFHQLLAAFHVAHSLILQEGGMLTTLCVAVALPVAQSTSWVLCVCNVGDSLCFVYNSSYGVREVTSGSHDSLEMRDMRNAGGALGPVDGRNPQLQNLTCSQTFVEPDDLIFITSDGISDNFDPVVGKFCVIKRTEEGEVEGLPRITDRKLSVCTRSSSSQVSNSFHRTRTCAASVPCVDAMQRQHLMLLRMRDTICTGLSSPCPLPHSLPSSLPSLNPSRLCTSLTQFSTRLSSAKRRTLEDPDLYKKEKLTKAEERARRKLVREKIADLPGKLDHASVVAYRVGVHSRTARYKRSGNERNIVNVEDMDTHEITVNIDLENFKRLNRVECDKTLVDTVGEYERLSMHIKEKKEEDEKKEDNEALCPHRATSPYEDIPVVERRRGRHERGSTGRHTLGVDVAWLKRLVTGKDKHIKPEDPPRSIGKRIRGLLGSSKNVTDNEVPSESSPCMPPLPHSLASSSLPPPPPSLPKPRSKDGNRSRPSYQIPIRRSFHMSSSSSQV